MAHEITPLQTLILWALLARGGSGFQKDLKPEPKPKDREALVRAGLISKEKGKRGAITLNVEDKGWHWASENMDAEISKHSNAGAVVLQDLLSRLGAYTKARNIALADVLAPQDQGADPGKGRQDKTEPQGPDAAPSDSHDFASLRAQLRAAFLDLTGDKFNTRVRLSDLREKLRHVDRAALDQTLLAIAKEEGAVLMQLDNRTEITGADRDAALEVGREPRHLLWLTK